MDGIYLLNDPKIVTEKAAGPKAANLARLISLRFPVPKGFCITGDIYREHIEKNNLAPLIQSVVECTQDKLSGSLSKLRKAITEAPLCESTKQDIERQFKSLNCNSVAVRSSATAEDLPGKSFAGQYETYLGIKDSVSCTEAIRKCWASLWSQRAFDYRERNKIDHYNVDMAVIVQPLIPADTSGVIFTADPITGRRESVVIEACFGLGEALVSGKVTPDRFLFDKRTKRLFFRTISEKKIECVPDNNGGVIEKTIENEKSAAHTLNIKQIKKLVRLAHKIETKFGCPQDIEWAIKDKQIWILQSRPITNLPEPKIKSWEERQVWTNSNVGEAVPDVITPLTWSILEPLVNVIFRPVLKMLCVDTGDNPVFGIIAGRVYFNINTILAAFKRFPNACDFDSSLFGGHQRTTLVSERLSIPPEDLPDVGGSLAKVILRTPISLIEVMWNGKRRRANLIALINQKITRINSMDLDSMTTGDVHRELDICTQTMANFDMTCLFTAIAAIPTLEKVCTKWLKDENNKIFNRLLSGTEGLEDAQTGFHLWNISQAANKNQKLRKLMLSDKNWQQIQEKLKDIPDGEEFLKQWNEFMTTNGHHCRGELDLANPRWNETPDYVLGLVRSFMLSVDTDPERNRKDLIAEREKLLTQCGDSLGFFKRIVFKHIVKRAQQGCLFRENSKNRAVLLLAGMRRLVLCLADRLTEQKIINKPDDIFFFKHDELASIIREIADFNPKQVAEQRQAEYERNCKITPPSVVMGIFDPEKYVEENLATTTDTLTGISVSPGIVTGTARVILHASNDYVRPNEILVAPFTDPGWTPYFVNAAGIVMDMGGLLSHGSIVAREYGIPCVVNVGPATKIIKTGQKITVDGNNSRVQIY